MKTFSSAVAALIILASPLIVQAKACYDDSIESVSEDGDIVKMLSGSVWEVDGADQVDSALWLAGDDVLICFEGSFQYKGRSLNLYTIINTDENGEKVGAQRLR